jgi:hypothetical protein
MRSVSGLGVATISPSHHARSSKLRCRKRALHGHALVGRQVAHPVEAVEGLVDEGGGRRGRLAAGALQDALDRGGAIERSVCGDLGVGCAEARAVQEMARALVADGRGLRGGGDEERDCGEDDAHDAGEHSAPPK